MNRPEAGSRSGAPGGLAGWLLRIPADRTAAMHIAILALAPLAVFANKGYLPALLVAVLFNLRRDAAVTLWRGHRLLVAGIALVCIWAAASLSFSPQHHVLQPVAVLALLPFGAVWVAGLARLSPEPRRRLEHTTLFAVLLMLVLYVEELLSGAFFTRLFSPGAFSVEIKVYEKVAAGIVLLTPLLWPLAVRLGRRSRLLALGYLGIAAAVIWLLPMATAVLALLVGAVVFLLAWRLPRAVLATMAALFLAYAAVAPWLSLDLVTITSVRNAGIHLPSGWEHRLGIWNYASKDIIADLPWGAGYDAARFIGARGDVIEEMTLPDGTHPPALPLHTHNGVIQVWLELGIPGVAGLALLMLGFVRVLWLARLDRADRAARIAMFAALLAPFCLSFGVWQSWWLAAQVWAAGLSVLLARPPDPAAD